MEGCGTAYLPFPSGGDGGQVRQVSIPSPSHFMAKWSVGMGAMLAYTPSNLSFSLQPMPTGVSEKMMGKGVLTAWVHSEGRYDT